MSKFLINRPSVILQCLFLVLFVGFSDSIISQEATPDIFSYLTSKENAFSTQFLGEFTERLVENGKAQEGYISIGRINEAHGWDHFLVKRGEEEGEVDSCVLEDKFNKSKYEPKQMAKSKLIPEYAKEAEIILGNRDNLKNLVWSETPPARASKFIRLVSNDFTYTIELFNDPVTGEHKYYSSKGQLKTGDINRAITATANHFKRAKKGCVSILNRVIENESGGLKWEEYRLTTTGEINKSIAVKIHNVSPEMAHEPFLYASARTNIPSEWELYSTRFNATLPEETISNSGLRDSKITERPGSKITEGSDSEIIERPGSKITEGSDSEIIERPGSKITEGSDSKIVERPNPVTKIEPKIEPPKPNGWSKAIQWFERIVKHSKI